MEENNKTAEVKTETQVDAPKESTPAAKKKSHKLLYIVLIVIGILLAFIVLVGVAAKGALDKIDPQVKQDLGKVYECSKKCQAMSKDQQNACVEQCAKEAGLDKYMSPMPTGEAAVGSVDSSGVYLNENFSFTPPSGWTQGDQQGVLVMFTNPKSPQTSINIVSEDAPGFTLTDYVKAAKEQLSKAIPGYKVSNEKTVTVNGTPAYQMDGSFSQSGLSLVNRQLLVVKDGKVYVLTATSTPDAWTANQAVIDASLKTFKLN